jgi:hypothetical protein
MDLVVADDAVLNLKIIAAHTDDRDVVVFLEKDGSEPAMADVFCGEATSRCEASW